MLRVRAIGPVLVALVLAACGGRARPVRFGSPMLGTASLPSAPLPRTAPPRPAVANRERAVRADGIRVSTAPRVREASAAAAAAIVADSRVAREDTRGQLRAPNLIDARQPLPAVRVTADLRTLVGRRDPRDPSFAALTWARELGLALPPAVGVRATPVAKGPAPQIDGSEVVTWAEAAGRWHPATEPMERGDLVVFDRVNTDGEADLIGVVVARDERGVTEFVYVGGGVIRRGFLDPARPARKRDASGATVNTFMRTGRRWPTKGTHYLAGELVAGVVR